ncbi:MAG: sigma-54-dependent Fis family transcriptional regulator [Polyangiaceae bacterium]
MLVLAEPTTELVRERWARVERLGLQRESDAYPVSASDRDLIERRERLREAFADELDVLELVMGELAAGPRAAILADREGVILSSRIERGALDPVTRVRLVEGARWGEETRGTNAIGTAVVEARPVAVVGDAHFEVRNRDLFCYATPIRDAFGEIALVLDVSGPLGSHDPAVGVAVRTAGLALEHALRARAASGFAHGSLAVIERLVRTSSRIELLVDATGVVRAASPTALANLGLSSTQALAAERVFGIGFGELFASSGARGARFETKAGTYRVEIDPLVGAAGRPLAVVVHLEVVARATPRRGALDREPTDAFDVILARDPAVERVKDLGRTFARTRLPVLLLAETGTGKELFARAIHQASERRAKPFVAVNCGAIAPSLVASELFGHAPGAFTGALRAGADGRIAAAHGGTLFLDEIAELSLELQAALLRVLDDGTYQRVGEPRERKADLRLVCATCRDLPQMVASGSFRKDLYYRIRGATLSIPALRDRSDATWLAACLLDRESGGALALSESAREVVAAHDWPGNVRELKSTIEYAAALANAEPRTPGLVEVEHLPAFEPRSSERGEARTRGEIVREAIDRALEEANGNVSEAARKLGVGRGTIYRALKARG